MSGFLVFSLTCSIFIFCPAFQIKSAISGSEVAGFIRSHKLMYGVWVGHFQKRLLQTPLVLTQCLALNVFVNKIIVNFVVCFCQSSESWSDYLFQFSAVFLGNDLLASLFPPCWEVGPQIFTCLVCSDLSPSSDVAFSEVLPESCYPGYFYLIS